MIGIGIVGCGNIAHTLAGVMKRLPEHMRIEAVAARDGHRARSFADEFGVAKAYGSYEELYSDDDVDLVYVATPHSHHMQCMLDALSHGRHVLCEKAFCVNARQAEAVFALARERHLFVAEAIWTRYMPSRRMISDIIESGRIGRVTTITANLGYSIIHKPRIADPALGGGALLDIGVYPLNFVLMAREGIGVRNMMGSCVKSSGGVDVRECVHIGFEDDSQAVIFADAECVSDRKGIIYGTGGRIEVENVNNPERITVWSGDRNPVLLEDIPITHSINGYEYELTSACHSIEAGLVEDPHMSWSETLRVLRYMDAFRQLWGVRLADEIEPGT